MTAARPAKLWALVFTALLTLTAGATLLRGLAEGDANAAEERSDGVRAMTQLMGREPSRCVFAGPDRELCSWRTEGRLFEAENVGEPAPAPKTITLLCEIATAEGGGEPRCRSYTSEPVPGADLPPVAAGGDVTSLTTRPLLEAANLAGAKDLVELSYLAGDVPERCVTGAGAQTCTWRLFPGSGGHAAIASGRDGVVWLSCRLPLDGSEREAGSCRASTLSVNVDAS